MLKWKQAQSSLLAVFAFKKQVGAVCFAQILITIKRSMYLEVSGRMGLAEKKNPIKLFHYLNDTCWLGSVYEGPVALEVES